MSIPQLQLPRIGEASRPNKFVWKYVAASLRRYEVRAGNSRPQHPHYGFVTVVVVLCWTVPSSGVVVVVVELCVEGTGVTTGDLLSSTLSFLLTKHPLSRETALAIVTTYARHYRVSLRLPPSMKTHPRASRSEAPRVRSPNKSATAMPSAAGPCPTTLFPGGCRGAPKSTGRIYSTRRPSHSRALASSNVIGVT
jgi:hypothetical protein